MSSISNHPGGLRSIQFKDSEGKRRTLRLGKVSKKDAERVRGHVDEIGSAIRLGRAIGEDTEQWLSQIGEGLYEKMSRIGLLDPRSVGSVKLASVLDATIDRRKDWKDAQRRAMTTTRNNLAEFFGSDRVPRTITHSDAKSFRHHLVSEKYAVATISKMIKSARSFFKDMVDRKIIRENPFANVEAGSQENPARFHYVTREDIAKVMAVCPNDEWRAIIALARYAGLRTPSESLLLRWKDVGWEEKSLRIQCPKTAGKGRTVRSCPIVNELRVALKALAVGDVDPEAHIIQIHRYTAHGFREALLDFLGHAGVKPWPKLWQNMRSTCATEWIQQGGTITEVSRWIGNTPKVLDRHYMQMRPDQFARAVERAAKSASVTAIQGLSFSNKTPSSDPETRHDIPGSHMTDGLVGPQGLSQSSVNTGRVDRRAARCAASGSARRNRPFILRSPQEAMELNTRILRRAGVPC